VWMLNVQRAWGQRLCFRLGAPSSCKNLQMCVGKIAHQQPAGMTEPIHQEMSNGQPDGVLAVE
jgi:hypothetical protein